MLNDYLKRFPELGPVPALATKLVHAEYRLRRLHGDCPALDTYKQRFPDQFRELENLAAAEAAIGPPSAPVPAARAGTPVVAGPPTIVEDAWATNVNFPGVTPKMDGPQGIAKDAWATKSKPPDVKPRADGPQTIAEGATLTFGGGYTLTDRLGSGSFGEVWRARSAGGGFENAIKVIFRSEDEDIQREVHALEVIRELRHPFLLSTQSFWFLGKRLYIVMELADCSLRQALGAGKHAAAGGVAPKQLLSFLGEAAEALDFLHSRGVMHRDIKPENILVLEGHVKVADFGVVRLQEGRAETATVLGTPLYMPPEVWGGQVSIHSDQYSLALTYAELRLGRRVFTTSGFTQLMQAHCSGEPDLGGMPKPERRVILRALAKNPERRFPSCGDFVRALDAAIPDPTCPDPERRTAACSTAPAHAFLGVRRPRAAFALLLFVLLLLVAAGLVWAFVPVAVPPAAALRLPASLRIHAGDQVAVTVILERAKRDGSVEVKCTDPSGDIQVEPNPLVISDGGTEGRISLKVSASAEQGAVVLTFDSPSGASATLELFIEPLATVPAGCFKTVGATVKTDLRGKNYYKTVHYLLPDKTPIALCLVEQEKADDLPTFYIMRDKVTNDLYRKSVAWREGATSTLPAVRVLGCLAAPGLVGTHSVVCSFTATDSAEPPWRLGGTMLAMANGKPIDKNVGADDRLPVLRVTAFEAHGFARWIRGRLPSIHEWDRAAGQGQPGRQGPFAGDWEMLNKNPTANIGVGRRYQGPLFLDEQTKDVSYFGCRHMSGNGKEWTNTLDDPLGKTVSEFAGRNPPQAIWVSLRGMGYTRMRPVLFAAPEPLTAEAEEAHPEIGFRVVVYSP